MPVKRAYPIRAPRSRSAPVPNLKILKHDLRHRERHFAIIGASEVAAPLLTQDTPSIDAEDGSMTFYFRDEDVGLEYGTYMQSDAPFDPDLPIWGNEPADRLQSTLDVSTEHGTYKQLPAHSKLGQSMSLYQSVDEDVPVCAGASKEQICKDTSRIGEDCVEDGCVDRIVGDDMLSSALQLCVGFAASDDCDSYGEGCEYSSNVQKTMTESCSCDRGHNGPCERGRRVVTPINIAAPQRSQRCQQAHGEKLKHLKNRLDTDMGEVEWLPPLPLTCSGRREFQKLAKPVDYEPGAAAQSAA